MFFMGFESSIEFEETWKRLEVIERWKELSIRPSVNDCHPDDRFLLPPNHQLDDGDDDDEEEVVDDLQALTRQSDKVRTMMNDILANLRIETTKWENSLVADISQIPSAGLGLFYIPCNGNIADENCSRKSSVIPKDTVICYYTGHVHTFSSSRRVVDDRSYLLSVRGDLLVDPRLCPHVKARYINDPLHDKHVNCVYKDIDGGGNDKGRRSSSSSSSSSDSKSPPPRLAVVTLRAIQPNEELFVSYGEAYWNQHQHGPGRQYSPATKKDAKN